MQTKEKEKRHATYCFSEPKINKVNRTRKKKETVNHFTLCWVCQDIGLKATGEEELRMNTTQRSDLLPGQELGLNMSSKWICELWNALQNESVQEETITPLVKFGWLVIIFNLSYVHDVSLTRIPLLPCVLWHSHTETLTMNCHNQTLGTDAIKKSKERTQLPLLILQWKCK